jgi:hypothetical protein
VVVPFRYVVSSDRVLFVLKDGGRAWEIKDFLVKQDRCEVVTIEGKDYPGKASKEVFSVNCDVLAQITYSNLVQQMFYVILNGL